MLEICLLRHGQTVFNTIERVQGWNDSPLTELGIYQARCAGFG
ncbi:MAG: histidine phosphatase family protein, partial [Erysipelotrichaceae bacterium]|nr:histidine phosphatase family protein [Erysipelotrichaceae bacterium]